MMKVIQNRISSVSIDINSFLHSSTRYMWASIGILFVAYLYFVGAITFSVINQKSLSSETKGLLSSMSSQETVYLSSQKGLTEDLAVSSGFVLVHSVTFATPKRAFAWNVGR